MGYSALSPQIAIKMGTMMTIHANSGHPSCRPLLTWCETFLSIRELRSHFLSAALSQEMQAYSVTCEEIRQAAAKYIWDGLGQNVRGTGTMSKTHILTCHVW